MNYQELNIESVAIRPTHLENLREIEEQEKEDECKQSIYSRQIDKRP